jgi:subtilisin family serine protease
MQSYLHFSSGSRFVLLGLLLCGALAAQPTQTVTTTISRERGVVVSTTAGVPGAAYDPSQVLVHFRNGAPKDFLPGSGPARSFPLDANLHVVPNPPGLSVAEAVRRYKGNPNVLYAEPDYVVQAIATPTDPRFGEQWDMTQISAPAAWDMQTDASDVVVAIIDTGIDFSHPDLQGNLWLNPADNTSHGFTCMNGVCTVGGLDDFGHGTHVAGTIGAAANNGIGIAGLNWGVKLLALKFLNSSGSGLISDAVLCFQKVAALKLQGVNIRVTNNSWGGGGFSQALKDAMAAVETTTVHACAAGNNGQNTDVSPMYPGAYDNRGIVSVLASDSSDLGASFTNFGLASVDIAAPGVYTLSTVPTGACALCDPSGYTLLSGTSMATPHVAGVLAALLHKIPALTAYQARDLILDPTSYDTLADPKARTTSTGGRLNFAKVLGHSPPIPPLNNFPVLTMGPDVTAAAGGPVSLTATATDADASDTLRMAWTKSVSTGTQWLFGWMLNSIFPSPSSSPFNFLAPSPARTATVPYYASVADGRGGGASGGDFVTVTSAPSPGLPPSGTLTVLPTAALAGSTLNVSFPATDPEGGPVAWDVWAAGLNGASGFCCFTGSSIGLTFNSAGVYRIRTQAIDRELNLSSSGTGVVVQIGGATGTPPIAAASLDKLSGPVPLTVNINMGGSFDPDGSIQNYFFICGSGGFAPGSQSSQGSCTFTTPGSYWMLLRGPGQ